MEKVVIELYDYLELDPKAKDIAKSEVEFINSWADDSYESYQKALDLYRLLNLGEDNEGEPIVIKGVRLYKFIQNKIMPHLTARELYHGDFSYFTTSHTVEKDERLSRIFYDISPIYLTGYCDDFLYLKPITDFMNKVDINLTNLDLLDTDLEYILVRQQLEEEEIFYKDKEFAEYCEDNKIKFLKSGKRFSL